MNEFKLTLNHKLFLLATLITNIGNGMHTIAISKLLYDETGKALSFGIVIILENIIGFIFPLLAGSIVDHLPVKKTSILCDVLRGSILLLSAFALQLPHGIIVLMILMIFVNIINCFYKSTNFKLIYKVESSTDGLLKINGLANTLFQVGQLLGVAIAAPIISCFSAKILFLINGASFFLCALLNSRLKLDSHEPTTPMHCISIFNDWIDVFKIIIKNKKLLSCIIFSGFDILCVNFINIMIVPTVSNCFPNHDYLVSFLDGSYALGAITSVYFINKVTKHLKLKYAKCLGPILEGLIFLFLALTSQKSLVLLVILSTFLLGVVSILSNIIYQTLLQTETSMEIKGKIVSFKNFIISILAIILVPLVSHAYDLSISKGMLCCGALLILSGSIIKLVDSWLERRYQVNFEYQANA